ncbi:MAG: hypothetical protein ABI945_02200 [Nitrospirales bacterium]
MISYIRSMMELLGQPYPLSHLRDTRAGQRSATDLTALWIVLLFTSTALEAGEAAETYTIKDIGIVGPGVSVEGMNNRGEVVGAVPASSGATRFRAWWYKDGKVTDLNTCGGIGCRAMDINASSQLVGNIGRDAYIYSHGKFIDLAAYARPPGIALALNDLAEVVGWYTLIPVRGENYPSERHAFLYRGRRFTDLGTHGGTESVATDINNNGQIVGYASTYGGETHAFLYDNGKMIDLGTLGGTESRANSINARGQIVGTADIAGSNKPHAFLYTDGKMTDLGALDNGDSQALCINESGQIVGMSGLHGFVYRNGKMVDLGSLLVPNAGWKSLAPRCLNDSGQIAGIGVFTDGKPHAFLMIPKSE